MTTEPVRTWASPEAAEVWRQSAGRRAQMLAAATEQLLAAAALRPGLAVLDVAAGTGDQTVLAAQRVLPGGSVLATDIAQSMLDVALEAARAAGLSNVEILAGDASTLEVGRERFDAAICRFGLMFMPDLASALARILGALKPGGRFAALVWASEAENPWIGMQLDLLRELGRLTSPRPSLAFTVALGAPGQLASALTTAGFAEVSVTPIDTPRVFGSLEDAFESLQTASPGMAEVQRAMTSAEREHYIESLRRRLAEFVQPDGRCVIPARALLGAAYKSPATSGTGLG